MGELWDKTKGEANVLTGKARRKLGEATDDPELEAKGAAQELKGEGQKLKGDVKGAINKL